MTQGQQSAATAAPTEDACCVTGTSPTPYATRAPALHVRLAWAPRQRRYDTVHVLGPGAVGRALLERFRDDRRRVIAVTDSTATLHDPGGLDADAVLQWKQAGCRLRDHPGGCVIPAIDAIARIDADILVDATTTDLARPDWTSALGAALERGVCVAAAAKAALCEAGAEWFSGVHASRVGCNAVLGGTGRSFVAELSDLQQRTRAIAIVGNASTTAILEVIERGGTLDDGVAEAHRSGFLEPDPELDLRGADAAVKLAIVAGIVTGRRIDPRAIACEDIRDIDLLAIRSRTRRNATTRLIGRLSERGELCVGYEEISRDSILAVPCGRVLYEYRLTRDERRIHIGSGLGAAATAAALWTDIRGLAAEAACHARTERGR
jgi:homoserine dehydrogenase